MCPHYDASEYKSTSAIIIIFQKRKKPSQNSIDSLKNIYLPIYFCFQIKYYFLEFVELEVELFQML